MTDTTSTIEQTTAIAVGHPLSPFLGDPVSTPIKPVFCNACGKSMQDPATGTNHIGISFSLTGIAPVLIDPYKPGVTYSVCYPCWMKAFGIKP